ncbi:aldo/keto reductase [Virgibacillus sp. 179-BFC.A HS]|uniref:Aldo/keto reductase n=1 Tax=Tigheibacillus jepli TaxID=3035914 RepID=A0ABU5CIG7_9BACI|nr:aldo/keto reductase [Virgibacillus sp. 179-BFC.A HS]MDY0405642.1 aldo/keto reductase [Virgibacillus sp. 179-BFC.A HS]
MKQNRLGKSDIYISELTLGCMSLGRNKQKTKNIIDKALANGINHLDTADLYDFGENEKIVGEAIRDKRKDIILTTKVGNHFNAATKDWFWDPSPAYIQKAVKDSLARLQTDYIDFYMLHGGTIDDPIDETIEAFETLKKEGVIRAYGISSIRPNVIREYVKKSNIDAVMLQYNMLDRRAEEEVLDLLQKNQISVLARGPLAKGILSEKGKEKLADKHPDGYLSYSFAELRSIQQTLENIKGQQSINELALGYVLTHPAVASAVFGASTIDQLDENMSISSPLNNKLYSKLKELTKPIVYENHR